MLSGELTGQKLEFLDGLLMVSSPLKCLLSGHIQGWECTRHPGTCRALTYLQGDTQGEWIPAECLGRNVIACKLGYVHRGTLPGQK